MSRKLSKVLALVMIFATLLAACAPGAAPAAGGSSASQPAAQPAAGEKVTLTMWHNHPEWKDRVQPILDAFEQENPTIHIELVEIPGPDYDVKRNTSVTAGEAADLIAYAPGSA